MKTMTCRQMGGPCDEKIQGATPEEMMNNGMAHVTQSHPDMAADIKAMSKDDPKMVEWGKQFQAEWEKTQDDN